MKKSPSVKIDQNSLFLLREKILHSWKKRWERSWKFLQRKKYSWKLFSPRKCKRKGRIWRIRALLIFIIEKPLNCSRRSFFVEFFFAQHNPIVKSVWDSDIASDQWKARDRNARLFRRKGAEDLILKKWALPFFFYRDNFFKWWLFSCAHFRTIFLMFFF